MNKFATSSFGVWTIASLHMDKWMAFGSLCLWLVGALYATIKVPN